MRSKANWTGIEADVMASSVLICLSISFSISIYTPVVVHVKVSYAKIVIAIPVMASATVPTSGETPILPAAVAPAVPAPAYKA